MKRRRRTMREFPLVTIAAGGAVLLETHFDQDVVPGRLWVVALGPDGKSVLVHASVRVDFGDMFSELAGVCPARSPIELHVRNPHDFPVDVQSAVVATVWERR